MLLDLRLPEYRASFGIDAGRKPVDDHVDRVLVQLPRVDVRRQRMIIGDEVKIIKFILECDPVFERTHKMSQVELSGRTHPAQYSFLTCQ